MCRRLIVLLAAVGGGPLVCNPYDLGESQTDEICCPVEVEVERVRYRGASLSSDDYSLRCGCRDNYTSYYSPNISWHLTLMEFEFEHGIKEISAACRAMMETADRNDSEEDIVRMCDKVVVECSLTPGGVKDEGETTLYPEGSTRCYSAVLGLRNKEEHSKRPTHFSLVVGSLFAIDRFPEQEYLIFHFTLVPSDRLVPYLSGEDPQSYALDLVASCRSEPYARRYTFNAPCPNVIWRELEL